MMKRVVSFSLWGRQNMYLFGAIRNAELCPKVYPGWVARFYVGASVPLETRRRLSLLGAEIVETGVMGDNRGRLWRFEAASDPEVGVMISRDCDSRVTRREAAAVEQWLNSPSLFHIMRDHPLHTVPILGGMWGVKAPLLRNMSTLISEYGKGDFKQVDQDFLRDMIYPMVRDVALVHDEFFGGAQFPLRRRRLEFVGEAYDENDHPSWVDKRMLFKSIASRTVSALFRRGKKVA